jgi:iron(III) transport system substrate-binding protein
MAPVCCAPFFKTPTALLMHTEGSAVFRAISVFIFILAIACTGCGSNSTTNRSNSAGGNKTITVYSPHGKYLEGDIKTRFEAAHPGYTVEFLDMGGGEILTRINAEKERPRADVWFGGSPSDFKRAETAGLLEAYTPEWTKNLPSDAKSPTGGWVATFRTPELIMYNSKKVSAVDAPKNWDDLLDPKWKGKIVIRDVRPSSTMKTIFGSLLLRAESIDKGFDFLKKLDANTGSYAANPQVMYDQLNADGPYAITLWNLADALLLKSDRYPSFDYVIPPETAVLVEPIAIIKNAPNSEGAKMFHDFVNSPEQLILMAQERHRLPARTDLPPEKLPAWMKDLKLTPMKIDWDQYDRNIDEWIARWDSEIKGKNK